MEQLQKIKNLLGMALVCTLVLVYTSCQTDLTYGTVGHGRINATNYSDYQHKNLQKFDTQKHQRLVKGKRQKLDREFMRPYKRNGKTTRQRMPRYFDE
jgi:hypothetical protein